MTCMAGGRQKKGLHKTSEHNVQSWEKQGSLFFRLPRVRRKFSDVVQGKTIAQDIQYHVQRVGGDGLVVLQPLDL